MKERLTKTRHLIPQACLTALLSVLCTSCLYNRPNNGPIRQAYVHQYGVEVDRNDWEREGGNGEIVTHLKDGVTVRRSYNNRVLDGPTTYSFPHSSAISKIENYSNGVLMSRQENYRSGMPASRTTFTSDLTLVEGWYEDGVPRSHELYDGDFLTEGEYYNNNNIIETQVVDGQGTRVIRTGHGRLEAEETIFAGQPVIRTNYFASGTPKDISHYYNGTLHGERKVFDESGAPVLVENWVHGELEGNVISYVNGQKVSETPYIKGKKEGVELRFNSTGEITERVSWHKDKLHGPTCYIIDQEESTEWYHKGYLVNKQVYDQLVPRR